MRYITSIVCTTIILAALCAPVVGAQSGPFDGKNFKGRIAWSSDGNHNDEDDWAASPVALAIFAEFGLKDKLVHFDYNSILNNTNPAWEKEHETSVLGGAERYGYRRSIFINCRKDRDAAIASIARAINESSADNPLYFVIAGPMEVPYLGIQKSAPEKRKFVYCISHSRWNDGFARYVFAHNKRSVIPSGIQWVQIRDQNRLLITSPFGRHARPDEWPAWHWMRDSADPKVRFLWERLRASTRADASDAGMAYFLATGDEEGSISKLRRLLEDRAVPAPIGARKHVRLEAENFIGLENFDLKSDNNRAASHGLSVKLAKGGSGRIRTSFDQPYTAAAAVYDVEVRYFDARDGRSRMALHLNGKRQGAPWTASEDDNTWKTHVIRNVSIKTGDEIALKVEGEAGEAGELDYVQLNMRVPVSVTSVSRLTATGPVDDANSMPGQVVVAGAKPGYLKYNGGGPVFLAGPDNPEDFFFQGALNADGTRSGGPQEEIIGRMAKARVNAFHCLLFRMKRCNFKQEGDDTHSPFVDHDPAKPLNEKVLNQWDKWLGMLEEKGIIVHLEFYNDATDVELMGWVLDAQGNLHPDEERFITGIVQRFKHHRNIMWGVEESANKLPAARIPHFRKVAEVIAKADNFKHPIVQSFVVPNDPEGDFPKDGTTSDPYYGDPNIRVATWLHVPPHGEDLEKAHQEYAQYYKRDAPHFVVMKNETFYKPYLTRGHLSRRYMWSTAMAGMHTLEAQHYANKEAHCPVLREDGFISAFIEQTDFHTMKPNDELRAGSTKWVLANPGESYIAYTYDCSGPMGVKGLKPGVYELRWMDTVSGEMATQNDVRVASSEASWNKPASMSAEIALYVKRQTDKR